MSILPITLLQACRHYNGSGYSYEHRYCQYDQHLQQSLERDRYLPNVVTLERRSIVVQLEQQTVLNEIISEPLQLEHLRSHER